jgi:hypothetical protein
MLHVLPYSPLWRSTLGFKLQFNAFPQGGGEAVAAALCSYVPHIPQSFCLEMRRRAICVERQPRTRLADGRRYALQGVRVSQPEEIQRGDGHPFSRTEGC